MNAKGEVLGSVGPYDSPDRVFEALIHVLIKHPEYNKLTEEEKRLPAVAKGQLLIDLGDYDKSRALLAKESTSQAHYLLGRLARFRHDWKEMSKQFAKVKSKDLSEDIRMEQAYELWFTKQFKKLRQHLETIPKTSRRYSEARYYQGLASLQLGDKKEALSTWKSTIQSCSQDPWIYRTDWAYSNVLDGDRRFFSTAGPRSSLLNRIGYMGRRNPDLKGPLRLKKSPQ